LKQIDFANGKIGQNVAEAAIPMLVAQVLNLLYSIVDRIYIGQIPGEGVLALGGIGLCFPMIIMITAFTNLYGAGGSPLCSLERGRGDKKKASHIMNTAFRLLILTGLIVMAAGYLFCTPLLKLFGASGMTMPYARTYMLIYLLGTIPSMIAVGMNPFINAQGFSGTGMLTVFIGAATNIILDPVFIFVFSLGVAGAAIATVISQFLSAVFALRFLTGNQAELRISFRDFFRIDKKTSLDIMGLGLVSFIMQFTNSLVSVICNHTLSAFGGDVYISVMTIVSSVRQILDTPVGAITDGASPVLSFNYGARKYGKVKEAIRIVLSWAVLYTLAVWILILLFPSWFIRIFSSDDTLLETAVPSLHLYFFAFVFQALQYSSQTVFKSLNMKRQAIFFSLFRKVIMVIPLTILLPRIGNLGPSGVFMAEPISNVIGGTACFVTMIFTVYRKLSAMDQADTRKNTPGSE